MPLVEKSFRNLFSDAVELWSNSTQIDILIEEMSELTKALLKARRNGDPEGLSMDVLEELVDVDICLAQLRFMFEKRTCEFDKVYKYEYNMKMNRLKDRIDSVKGQKSDTSSEWC
jgi:hypothetical protein